MRKCLIVLVALAACKPATTPTASRIKPAKLLAVFVANSEEKALTTPVEESNAAERKQ